MEVCLNSRNSLLERAHIVIDLSVGISVEIWLRNRELIRKWRSRMTNGRLTWIWLLAIGRRIANTRRAPLRAELMPGPFLHSQSFDPPALERQVHERIIQ